MKNWVLFIILMLVPSLGFCANQAQLIDGLAIAGSILQNGQPNSYGKIYFYDASTKTLLKNVYLDAQMTKIASQPITLDASGCAKTYGNGKYYIKICDKSSVIVKTIDFASYISLVDFGGLYVDVSSYGNNSANGADLQTLITKYLSASSNITFLFREQTNGYLVAQNLVFGNKITLKFMQGAYLNISTGYSVIFTRNYLETGAYQIFSGNGTVSGNILNEGVLPQWFGAKTGDTEDDIVYLQKAANFAATANLDLIIQGGTFSQSGQLSIKCNMKGNGFATLKAITPSINMILLNDSRILVDNITLSNGGLPGVHGFIFGGNNILMTRCVTSGLYIGFECPGRFSNTMRDCSAINGQTGISAYGLGGGREFNDMKVIGGSYYTNSVYAMYFGDERQPGATTSANINDCVTLHLADFSADAGIIKIEHALNVYINNVHMEGAVANYPNPAIDLGSLGIVYPVKINNCFFKNYRIGVQTGSYARSVSVENNLFTNITWFCVWIKDRLTKLFTVNNNFLNSGALFNYQINCDGGSDPYLIFSNVTNLDTNRVNGLLRDQSVATPNNGRFKYGDTIATGTQNYICNTPALGFGLFNPTTNITGVVSGNTFTFDILSKINTFSPGDAVRISGDATVQYVKSLNTVIGTMELEYCTLSGAVLLMQVAPTFIKLP